MYVYVCVCCLCMLFDYLFLHVDVVLDVVVEIVGLDASDGILAFIEC